MIIAMVILLVVAILLLIINTMQLKRNARERKEVLMKLEIERNKFLKTLMSIGDGVIVVDSYGKVTMLNKVAEKLTGWTLNEAEGKHYKEVFLLSHEESGLAIDDPIEGALETDEIQELGEHAILTSKDGTTYYLEDSAAPIKDENNKTTGVVLVFRDITEKKEQRKKIEYLSFHDSLTGLYNRRFFEVELKRIDTKENLPISVIVGDMNGLKLTNDIFGHAVGDRLLQELSQVFLKVCRANDIISRVGGDEFIILLPKTTGVAAREIMYNIKREFSKIRVKAIKGSISMGYGTKRDVVEDIVGVVNNAEKKMYSAKAFDRSKIKSTTLKNIIESLHINSYMEEKHSKSVSCMCERIGKALNLSEFEVRRLKEAGYLHDIGKIVLDDKLLTTYSHLTDREQEEVAQHPIAGYRILNSFDDTLDLADSILAHHERWDGTGYPKGLKGKEIPKLARIIAIAEAYDTMINYRKGISKLQVIEEIKKQAGLKFDPEITDIFVRIISEV